MTEIANVQYQPFTTAVALAEALAPGVKFRLIRIEMHLSSAPTTSENFTATLDAGAGAAYDVVLTTRDLSADSVTDYVIEYGEEYTFESNDAVDIAYTNTDTRTISGRYVYELQK